MTDNKSDSSDASLDVSGASRRLDSTEVSDPIPVFHERRNMTSEGFESGSSSPIRARTMKEYDQQIASLQKENFNLKLRIYFLEEDARKKFRGSGDEFYQLNIELKVEAEGLRNELHSKDVLLKKASLALDNLSSNHEKEMNALRDRLEAKSSAEIDRMQEELNDLKELLKVKEKELSEADARLRRTTSRISELEVTNERSKKEDEGRKSKEEATRQHRSQPNLMDFSLSENNTSVLEEQLAGYEDELDKKNKLIEQLRCALKVKDVLIEQAESEKNEVESKFKDTSRVSESEEEEEEDEGEQVKDGATEYRSSVERGRGRDNRDRILLEGYVEKLSNRVKDKEDEIKAYQKNAKDLESKCLSLMQIVEELKAHRPPNDGNDYDFLREEEEEEEGMKSSWSRLCKGDYYDEERDQEEEESERDFRDSRDFDNISHLRWKNMERMTYGDHESSRQSSADAGSDRRKLERENAHLKDRLWAVEQQFQEWKNDDTEAHLAEVRRLKDELAQAVEVKDGLEEQCSELEQELFRVKRYFSDLGSVIVDFDGQEILDESSSSPEFVDKLSQVYSRQERLLKEREEAISSLEAENAEERKRAEEEIDCLKREIDSLEKARLENDGEGEKAALRADLERLKQDLCEKEKELSEAEGRFQLERDSFVSRCKELETINLQLNGKLLEAKHSNDALGKKLAVSDALGQQLNNLLKEGGDITRQLNVKTERLAVERDDLSAELERKSREVIALEMEIGSLREAVSEKELTLDSLSKVVADGKSHKEELERKLASHEETISSYEHKLARQEALIKELNTKLTSMRADLSSLMQKGEDPALSELPHVSEGSSDIELEKLSQKKEQLLGLMNERRKSTGKRSGAPDGDDLIRQWSELVCTIEREWRRELKDTRHLEQRWHLMQADNQSLSLAKADLEIEIRKRDIFIEDLKSEIRRLAVSDRSRVRSGASFAADAQKFVLRSYNDTASMEQTKRRTDSANSSRNSSERPMAVHDGSTGENLSRHFGTSGSGAVTGVGERQTFTDSSTSNRFAGESFASHEAREDIEGRHHEEEEEALVQSLKLQLAVLQEERDRANEVIVSLKEHIALNPGTDTGEKFNPDLILRLVDKINKLKKQLAEHRRQSGVMDASVGTDAGRPTVLPLSSSDFRSPGGSETESARPPSPAVVATRPKNIEYLEDLKQVVTNLKEQFRAKLSRSNRPSFGRLSELFPTSTVGNDILDESRLSFVSGFDSTHVDDSIVMAATSDERDAFLVSDLLAESEGRCRLMRARMKELVRFLRHLLDARKGSIREEGEERAEDSMMATYLDETAGFLDDVNVWLQEQDNNLELSSSRFTDNLVKNDLQQGNYHRFSSDQASFLFGRSSLAPVPEGPAQEGGLDCQVDLAVAGDGIARGIEGSERFGRASSTVSFNLMEFSAGRPKQTSDDIESLQSELSDCRLKCEALERELSAAKERVKEMEEKAIAAPREDREDDEKKEDGKEELVDKVEELLQVISDKERRVLELVQSIERMERESVERVEELEAARVREAETRREAESLRREKQILTEAVLHSEEVIPDLARSLEEAKNANFELSDQLEKAKYKDRVIRDLKESLEEKETEIGNGQLLVASLKEKIAFLDSELDDAKERISTLEVDLEKIQFDMEITRSYGERKSAKLKEVEEKLAKLETKCQNVESELEQQVQQKQSLERELQEKLEKLGETERRALDLLSRYEDLQHKHETIQLEKESLERRLSEERQAVRSALSGGAIGINQGSVSLDVSRLSERRQQSIGTPECPDCVELREELIITKGERDMLSLKVMELSSKGSFLTSEVVRRLSTSSRDGGDRGLAPCCSRAVEKRDRYIAELKEVVEAGEKIIPEVAEEISGIVTKIREKKLTLVELDSRCKELEVSLREAATGMRSAMETTRPKKTTPTSAAATVAVVADAAGDNQCMEEYRQLVEVLKAENRSLRKSSAIAGEGTGPPAGDLYEDKENLELGVKPAEEGTDPPAQGPSAAEFSKLLESNIALRKELARAACTAEGVPCDHSEYKREISRLKKQMEDLRRRMQRDDRPSSTRDPADLHHIAKTEIIDQINKTRKILALTSRNMALRMPEKAPASSKAENSVKKAD